MLVYKLQCKNLNKKLLKIVKKSNVTYCNQKILVNTLTTYLIILMCSNKFKNWKKFKKSYEYSELLKIIQDNSIKNKITREDIPYSFINLSDLEPINNLINNEKILKIFLSAFEDEDFSRNNRQALKLLLNDIAILFLMSDSHIHITDYKKINDNAMRIFSYILEINKNVQNKIQSLFTAKSNEVIVLINTLLDL